MYGKYGSSDTFTGFGGIPPSVCSFTAECRKFLGAGRDWVCVTNCACRWLMLQLLLLLSSRFTAPAPDDAPLWSSFCEPSLCWRSIPRQSEFGSFYTYYKFTYIYYARARTFIISLLPGHEMYAHENV